MTPFWSIDQARTWVQHFVCWYNNVHLHSAINFVTPAERHDGRDVEILKVRAKLYQHARQDHPERWSRNTRDRCRIEVVKLNPKTTHSQQDKPHAVVA